MTSYSKRKILVIGPYPPPIGGIALHIKNFMEQKVILENCDVILYRTGKRNSNIKNFNQIIIDFWLMLKYLFTQPYKGRDIIHIHTASYWSFYRNVVYVLISKFFSNAKIILHIHGGKFFPFFFESSIIFKRIIRYSIQLPDAVIVTSSGWVPIIKEICDNQENIFPVPNGYVSTHFFPIAKNIARTRLNLPKDKKILLTIGSLDKAKGHKYFIESMRYFDIKLYDAIIYIIGDGLLKESLTLMIEKYSLQNIIFLLEGNKSPKELNLYINACDLFVLPSLHEGNPTVMFEALGCGKPFIGTKVGGIPDVIISDEYGLLVEPANPKKLAEKILDGLKREWEEEKIRVYAERFTWTNIANMILDIYSLILERNKI